MTLNKIIFSIIVLIFFSSSCKKSDADFIEPSKLILNQYFNKFSTKDFENKFGLKFLPNFKESQLVSVLYLNKSEKYIITPVYDSKGIYKGKLYSLMISDTSFNSLVIDLRDFNFNNGTGDIKYVSLNKAQTVLFAFNKYKIYNHQESTVISEAIISSNSLASHGESSCTSSCYKKAKDACDADGDCKILCDLLPSCNSSIVVSCFLHCSFR